MMPQEFADQIPHPRAQCRLRSGAHIEMSVLDISIGGCMVDRSGWSAKPDDRVLIKLPGLSFQPATIVWVEDETAGMTFEQPLHEAVFTHLQQLTQRASPRGNVTG